MRTSSIPHLIVSLALLGCAPDLYEAQSGDKSDTACQGIEEIRVQPGQPVLIEQPQDGNEVTFDGETYHDGVFQGSSTFGMKIRTQPIIVRPGLDESGNMHPVQMRVHYRDADQDGQVDDDDSRLMFTAKHRIVGTTEWTTFFGADGNTTEHTTYFEQLQAQPAAPEGGWYYWWTRGVCFLGERVEGRYHWLDGAEGNAPAPGIEYEYQLEVFPWSGFGALEDEAPYEYTVHVEWL